MKVSEKNKNVSFLAALKYNRAEILNAAKKDTVILKNHLPDLSKLLDEIDSFSKIKEDSIVELVPKVNRKQFNLVAIVKDSSEQVSSMVEERSGRSLLQNETFKNRYLSSIKTKIKNVAIAKESLNEIGQKIMQNPCIKGFSHISGTTLEKTEKNMNNAIFNDIFKRFFLEKLEKGYNPKTSIIKLFDGLKRYKDQEFFVSTRNSIKNSNKKNQAHLSLKTKSGEKEQEIRIFLPELFVIPREEKIKKLFE